MWFKKRRTRALLGLSGLAALAVGFLLLPLAMPHLRDHREWIKAVRARTRGAFLVKEEGVVQQVRGNDCGAACLKMVLAARGIALSLPDLTLKLKTTESGTSMLNLRLVAAGLGVAARSWVITCADLHSVPLPAIAFINEDHFVVIRRMVAPEVLEVDDPALGRLRWPVRSFRKAWQGQALVFDPAWIPP